jgi:hypothetical protein
MSQRANRRPGGATPKAVQRLIDKGVLIPLWSHRPGEADWLTMYASPDDVLTVVGHINRVEAPFMLCADYRTGVQGLQRLIDKCVLVPIRFGLPGDSAVAFARPDDVDLLTVHVAATKRARVERERELARVAIECAVLGARQQGGETSWSLPLTLQQLAKLYGVTRNTMSGRLRRQDPPNRQLSRQSWQVDLRAVPEPVRRHLDPPAKA